MTSKAVQAAEAEGLQRFDPFSLMDALDDEAILRELEGIATETLVYTIRDKSGKELTGLSKGGTDEACNVLAHQREVIREEELHYTVQLESGEALFTVRAARYVVAKDGREVKLDQVFGVKRQPLWYDGRQAAGPRVLNPHWYEQGAMKAARNARARLVPANVKAEIIARAKQTKRARVVDAPVPDRPAPAAPAPAGPPPAAPAKPADPADSTWKGRRLGDYATEELLAMQREMAAARKPEKFTRVLDAIETVLAGRQGA